MPHRSPLTAFIVLAGAAALLTGCAASPGPANESPGLTIDTPATPATTTPTDTPGSTTGGDNAGDDASGDDAAGGSTAGADAGAAGAALPAPIVSIDYEVDAPGQHDDDDDRTTSDPGHIAELTALLERHGIVGNYDRDEDCDNDWEVDVDANLENGSEIEIEIEVCSPNAFEQEFIDLVTIWP